MFRGPTCLDELYRVPSNITFIIASGFVESAPSPFSTLSYVDSHIGGALCATGVWNVCSHRFASSSQFISIHPSSVVSRPEDPVSVLRYGSALWCRCLRADKVIVSRRDLSGRGAHTAKSKPVIVSTASSFSAAPPVRFNFLCAM